MPHAIAGTCQVLKGRDERMDRREESSLASRMSQVHSAAPLVKASHVEHSGGGGQLRETLPFTVVIIEPDGPIVRSNLRQLPSYG